MVERVSARKCAHLVDHIPTFTPILKHRAAEVGIEVCRRLILRTSVQMARPTVLIGSEGTDIDQGRHSVDRDKRTECVLTIEKCSTCLNDCKSALRQNQ